ncbi:MAG TPA: MBL fold metallo-hydrolase, partial [Firmicutes bacterium]|nr:MBL fold metallo-hydrolase [Bacillota bacterium]
MEYRSYIVGNLMANCYLLWSGKEAGIIDPGGPATELEQFMAEHSLKLKWIVNTHGHADHIAGNGFLHQKYGAPILISAADRPMLTSPTANLSVFMGESVISPDADRFLNQGDKLVLGAEELSVIATPGHSPGGISLYTPGLLFVGDTLFYESIGRTDFPGGDHRQLVTSIREQLFTLPAETVVLPGHGEVTAIGYEMKHNP